MTPDERLELILGQGVDDQASGGLPASAGGIDDGAFAALGELQAIATALRRMDLPVSTARSDALRVHLEEEAARLASLPAKGGEGLPRSWLPWVGGILLLLTTALWLVRHPSVPVDRGGRRDAGAPAPAGGEALGTTTGPPGRVTARGEQLGEGRPTPTEVPAATMTASPTGNRIPTAAPPPSSRPTTGFPVTPISPSASGQSRGDGLAGTAGSPPAVGRVALGGNRPRVSDGYLRGRVTDVEGRAIAAAEVTAYRQDRTGLFVQRTDADGRYAILLPWGRYRLEARASGFASRWYRQAPAAETGTILQWDVDSPDSAVDFALPSAPMPVESGG